MLDKLRINHERKVKTAFHASDFGKPDLDLYFAWTEEPVTNPASWNETLKWGAGNGVEAQMLKVLKDSGIVTPDYDQKQHGRVDFEREGIVIHGYIDALTKGGRPIEIKSINNKNEFDIGKYERGYPRESYVGQLATYLEYTNAPDGVLFVSSIDGLNYFWFTCERISKGKYKCGNVVVDIATEYQRWGELYRRNIAPRVMPDLWQYRYKYDVSTLDWQAQSKASITKARTGKAVIGDWQIQWSPWKNRIIELQGTHAGYSEKEMEIIMEKTKGYTTWKK